VQPDLQLVRVGKVYDNGAAAVIDFDLDVRKGEFIAFLGPSGCGKTTTLRMIAGFESITSGDILIRGRRINDLPPERRPTSMIFQSYALFPHMSVRGNISYGLKVKKLDKKAIDDRVDRILDKLDLTEIAESRTDRLSGGQRQRIALARGLVVEPDILLLDEPLGALDANLRKAIQAELRLLQRNLGITFVFVTHAQSEALALSDRIVVMNQGRVEQISPPHQLYTRPRTQFVATFIGRNIVFDGERLDQAGDVATVKTGFGIFTGLVADPASGPVKLIVPSEAVEIEPRRPGEPAAEGIANCISATIEGRERIGNLIALRVNLAGEMKLRIEGHVDKFVDALAVGAPIWLSWDSGAASVIPARSH
jgi:ABC-type Fe3+/spermidine/putrescine transport system ATPase subunit